MNQKNRKNTSKRTRRPRRTEEETFWIEEDDTITIETFMWRVQKVFVWMLKAE